MPLVSIDCPYCLSANTAFTVMCFGFAIHPNCGEKPIATTHEAVGLCQACSSYVALFFNVIRENNLSLQSFSLPATIGQINHFEFPNQFDEITLMGYLPNPPKAEIPSHLPDNIAKSFLGAEKARLATLWTEAAASYGKAIDRGISPLMPDDEKKRTLGQKMHWIKDNGNLAGPLTEWIEVVLKDRNFAAHDDDRDFESAEEIETIRSFANILLTYLYTMPEKVRIARGEVGED